MPPQSKTIISARSASAGSKTSAPLGVELQVVVLLVDEKEFVELLLRGPAGRSGGIQDYQRAYSCAVFAALASVPGRVVILALCLYSGGALGLGAGSGLSSARPLEPGAAMLAPAARM